MNDADMEMAELERTGNALHRLDKSAVPLTTEAREYLISMAAEAAYNFAPIMDTLIDVVVGDLWALGLHPQGCGVSSDDLTDAMIVGAKLAEAKADTPPYVHNVNLRTGRVN